MNEKIEIKNIDGVHYAFYKNIKLPFLIKSVITQDYDGITRAKLTFEVDLEKPKKEVAFTVDGKKILGTIFSKKK